MPKNLIIEFDTVGTSKFRRLFTNLWEIPDDFSPLWRDMADAFYTWEQQWFDSEGDGTWRPLNPRYEAEKAKKYGPMPMLVRTGRMKASLTSPNAEGSVYDVRPLTLELGTEVTSDKDFPYPIAHQTGNIKSDNFPPDTHPPKRVVLNLDFTLRRQWDAQAQDWLKKEVGYATEV